jgi:hypothetical protein
VGSLAGIIEYPADATELLLDTNWGEWRGWVARGKRRSLRRVGEGMGRLDGALSQGDRGRLGMRPAETVGDGWMDDGGRSVPAGPREGMCKGLPRFRSTRRHEGL